MAPHYSTLAWKIPWMEEPGRLPSMGLLRVGHDRVTSLSLFNFMHWSRNDNPLQCSCLENPRDGGAWWAAVYGVAQSQKRLTWLSSSSSRNFLVVQWLRFHLPVQGVWVSSLVKELRYHLPHGQKAINIKQKQYCNKFNKDLKKRLSLTLGHHS